MQKIAIITGGSKGIGLALCKKYSKNDYTVFSIARTKNNLTNITQFSCDISDINEMEKVFLSVFSTLKKEDISDITLINNAGILGDIAPVEKNSLQSIEQTVKVNLTATIATCSLFIKLTKNWKSVKKIINISSGAAVSPYEGWSSYCSTKAGVDMLTQVIAKEQSSIENGVSIFSIHPGVVDTQMQSEIRSTSKKDFAMVDKFVEIHKNEQLFSSDFVAAKIFVIDTDNLIENGSIMDIRGLVTE